MGFDSWNCKGCGHSLLSDDATSEINEWMTESVALFSDGTFVIGIYDGCGYIGEFDISNGPSKPCCYHKDCWEMLEKPGFSEPSQPSDDQGFFFNEEHDFPKPQSLQDIISMRASDFEQGTKKLSLIQHSLQGYRSRYDEIKRLEDQSWKKTFTKICPHCKQSIKPSDHEEQSHQSTMTKLLSQQNNLKQEMLEDETVSFLVCDISVTWQAKQGESNCDIDKRFTKQFPMAITDSESNQGWGYINSRYIEKVRQYMSEIEGLVEKSNQSYGTFAIFSNDNDEEKQTNLSDPNYTDRLVVQWNWEKLDNSA